MSTKAPTSDPPTSSDAARVPIALIAWPALAMMLAARAYAAIIAVAVIVLAVPAQLLLHFRRPGWASSDAAEVVAESAEQKPVHTVSERNITS